MLRSHMFHGSRQRLRIARLCTYAGLAFVSLVLSAQSLHPKREDDASEKRAEQATGSQNRRQGVELIDLDMYQRIIEEGINHSHVMEYSSALADDIGPRLTGSPNMMKANAWARDQFTAMGCVNAHLESWGAFGQGWQQLNTWVRMVSPDTAVLIAQAKPWSPSTGAAVTGNLVNINIDDARELEQYKGKLAGKIVLFGKMRPVHPVEKPLWRRYTDQELTELTEYPGQTSGSPWLQTFRRTYSKRSELISKMEQFFVDEHVAGVITPSPDGQDGGGSGGTIFDAAFGDGTYPEQPGHAGKVPVVVMAIENYGRLYRLLQANVPVRLEMDVETKFTGEQQGYDTIAEIPGTDPNLKDQVVMLGGHLDSWAAGTGATDNGAGVAVTMEAMRILNSLHIHPRRTIRAALWSGEEEGMDGSRGYVSDHFGSFPLSTAPDQMQLPEWLRQPAGPVHVKPEQKLISAYFNLDNGSGRIRGLYLQGNVAVAPVFEQWIAPLKNLGVTTLTLRNTGGTDHQSFDAVGIPAFQFIQDPLDYETRTHHSNMDVYEELSEADLKQAAVVEAIFVYNAAMRDLLLPRKPLETSQKAPVGMNPQPPSLPGVFPDAISKANPNDLTMDNERAPGTTSGAPRK